MKTKLQILLVAFAILFSLARASAQQPQPAPVNPPPPTPINPQTGLPEPAPPAVDPATGLPADGSAPFHGPLNPQTGLPEGNSTGAPSWIDPAWTDPDKVLPSVELLNLPLTEVARYMREQFTNNFDVILPNAAPDTSGPAPAPLDPNTGLPGPVPIIDPTQINVDLQLKNVRASEIFSAMNLQFELNKSPYRWELTMNGSRPTALLRVLPQLVSPPPTPPQRVRRVFFVGTMLDKYPGTNDAQKLQSISDTIVKASVATGLSEPAINTYPSGQLIIVLGTPDQVDLAEQTVRALKDKAEYEKSLQDQHAEKSK